MSFHWRGEHDPPMVRVGRHVRELRPPGAAPTNGTQEWMENIPQLPCPPLPQWSNSEVSQGSPKDSVLVAHSGNFNMPSIGFWVLPVSLAPSPAADSYSCLPVLMICWGDPNEGRNTAGDSKRSLCKRLLLSQRGAFLP